MAYLSLYRKYRSQTFGDLVGQDHVVRTLQNGISSGRIAHAYLFTGPRGTGKTSTARLLAKALCCEHGPTPTPDNECEICRSITAGNCVDVLEMDAASEAGVEDIREKIVEVVEYQPMIARYKVFIIDEVHDLSGKAFDALLKTIEEPPPHIIFILATTEYNKVPATIRSRCQKHEFHRASMGDLVARLQYVLEGEGLSAEPAAISAMARMADGGYRDALTLLEQAILTSDDGRVTLSQVYDQLGLINDEMVDGLLFAIKDADVAKIIEVLAEVFRLGRDPRSVVESLLYRLADLTRAAYGVDSAANSDAGQEAVLHETAARLGRERLLNLRSALSEAHRSIRDISLPRIWLESELVRMATQPAMSSQPKSAPSDAKASAPPRPVPETGRARPEAAPKFPLEKLATEPKKTPEVVPTSQSGDERWQNVVTQLGVKSKSMGMKLLDARLAEDTGDQICIEFVRSLDSEWMQDKPEKIKAVLEAVRAHFGPAYTIRYAVGRQAAVTTSVAAVELPAEGARLEQLAKDILAPEPSRENES